MIEIIHKITPLVPDRKVRRVVLSTWKKLRILSGTRSLSVVWVGSNASQDLNRRYRGKSKPTNVLSFEYGDTEGVRSSEIVLCSSVIRREAVELRIPIEDWAVRLLVHGLLHVEGFLHNTRQKRTVMERAEKEIMVVCGYDSDIVY